MLCTLLPKVLSVQVAGESIANANGTWAVRLRAYRTDNQDENVCSPFQLLFLLLLSLLSLQRLFEEH